MDQVKLFKGCLPQILLGPFLNTLSQLSRRVEYCPYCTLGQNVVLLDKIETTKFDFRERMEIHAFFISNAFFNSASVLLNFFMN